MNTIEIEKLPAIATRSQWTKILGLLPHKLTYEEKMGRLHGSQRFGYNVMYDRKTILEWMRKYN